MSEDNNQLSPEDLTTPKGYRRVKERHPEIVQHIDYFSDWLARVTAYLNWIDDTIPDNVYASKRELLDDFFITPQGLELLEKLNLDIHAEHEGFRTYYDVKKVLRAIVALPTITRLKGKKLVRKGTRITTVLKEILDDTLTGRTDPNSICAWEMSED